MSDRPTPITDEFAQAECCDLEHAMDLARDLERQRDAYAETLRGIAKLGHRLDRSLVIQRHPELAQEASQP